MILKSHSRCSIELIDNRVIRKSTIDADYVNRFKRQIEKQKNIISHDFIKTPQVLKESFCKQYGIVDMEYVHGSDFITAMQHMSFADISLRLTYILAWILENIEESEYKDVTNAFEEKFKDKSVLKPKSIILPIGQCHGDLTLSNILLTRHESYPYLIDFLDSFVESPLLDIVKLRQDTELKWNLYLNDQYHNTQYHTLLSKLDDVITEFFPLDPQLYGYLQYTNLIRILPYARNSETISFLQEKIAYVLDTYLINSR